jgi:hypothetical protein
MKKKMMMTVVAAVFLNVSGAYAETVWTVLSGAVFSHGDGGVGVNSFLPQVGYMSAEKDSEKRLDHIGHVGGREVPYYVTRPLGWKFNDFDYSILFDLTVGFGFGPDVLTASSGVTAEFYFLPALGHCRIGAGIGAGWGLIGWNLLLQGEDIQNPYGAPYARITIPVMLGLFKTGVYFDYHFTDEPYTQLNFVYGLML